MIQLAVKDLGMALMKLDGTCSMVWQPYLQVSSPPLLKKGHVNKGVIFVWEDTTA
jgi:hypothetical protein